MPFRALAALLAALAALSQAAADPIEAWGSLVTQPKRRGGLFATWDVDQRNVLAALRSAEHVTQAQVTNELERRVREDPEDPAAHDLLGLTYQRYGRLSEAAAQFRTAYTVDPEFHGARIHLADLFRGLGSVALEAAELAEVVRQESKAPQLRRRLAGLYAQLGRPLEAAEVLRTLVGLAPDDLDARVDLARALLQGNQPDPAMAALEEVLRQDPGRVPALLLRADCRRAKGDWKAAREELEAISKSRPTSLAGAQLGLVLLHQKKFEAAREAFRDALSARRPEPALLIGATVAAQGAGRFEDAMRACQALRRAGRVQIAAYLLANLWLSQGDAAAIRAATPTLPQGGVDLARSYDQLLPLVPRPEDRRRLALLLNLTPAYAAFGWAAEALETALAAEGIAPKSLLVGQIVAERYASAGKPEEELRVRERLAREFPDDPALGLALARACLARRQIARAREAAEELLRRFPGNLEALLLAADAALRSDDTAAAAARACEALASHPRDPQALSVLLEALVVKGDFRDAAAAIASRARENPTFLAGPFERGILAAAEGKTDRAMEHCNIGLSRSPQDARLRLLAGLLFEERGGLAEAIGHFEVAHWVAPQSYAPTVHLARAALRLGRINLALATYHDGIRAAPDRMPLQLEFADALSYAGRSSEVAEHLRSLAPPDAATRRAIQARLARECLSQGDAARALALLEPILSEDPADALARHVAVQAYRQRDNLRAAIALCERALAEAPGADIDAQLGVLLLLDGRAQDAAERLGRAADRLKGGARSETLKWRAAALLATGQNAAEPARAAVQEAVASMGGNADSPPSSALALVLALCGLDAPAQRELDRLARSNPDAPQWVRGELAKLRGDPELLSHVLAAHAASVSGWSVRAAALLEAALARAPGDPGLLHDLALARANAGQTEKAVEAAQELTRRQPQSGTAYSLLGRALLDAEKAAPALDALRRAAALLGKQSPQPWLTLADRFSAAGSVEDTIEAYRTALAIDPKHVPAANNLAWLYATERPDRLEDAELLAAAAAQKEHKVASYRDTLGWVYFLRKKPDDARREILAALELAPSQPLYLYHLGVIHFAQGRNDRARRALVRALAIDPKFQGAETARATLDILKTRTPPPKAPEPPPQPK